MKFAKLFNYQTGQLLVTLDHDFANEECVITCRSDAEDLTLSTKAEYESLELAAEAFANFDSKQAAKTYTGMSKMLGRSKEKRFRITRPDGEGSSMHETVSTYDTREGVISDLENFSEHELETFMIEDRLEDETVTAHEFLS